jgi:uncharacterized peroxidase-related enzyme
MGSSADGPRHAKKKEIRMSRIPPAEAPADPEIAEMMAYWKATKGYAPNTWQTMLRRPKVFLAYRNLHKAVMMDEGEVPRALKFMVAAVVSNAAGDAYCTAHNAENAAHMVGVPIDKVEALLSDASSPLFTPAEKAALALAETAGRDPVAVAEAHFAALKAHFSDDAIVEIVGVIALLGWLTRWAQTLAPTLEPKAMAFAEAHLAKGGWSAGIAGKR